MKGFVMGVVAGMAAGALLSANFSEVRKMAKKAGETIGLRDKPGSSQQNASGRCECECGEDCEAHCGCECDEQSENE